MTTKELAIATSTVWVVLAAVLVMFMQAGFAFLEAGLTRMKNVGTSPRRTSSFSPSAPSSTSCRLWPWRSATGATGSSAAPASSPRSTTCCGRRRHPSPGSRDPGRRGLPLPGRLRRRLARDRLGGDGRTDEALGLLRLRHLLHRRLLRRLALGLEPGRLAVLARDAGLRGLDGRPLPGRPRRRSRERSCSAPRIGKFAADGKPNAIPGPQHGLHHARRPHPLVRVVRLQRGLDAEVDAGGVGFFAYVALNDESRRGGRRLGAVVTSWIVIKQARSLDDAERCRRRSSCDHGRVRLRRTMGCDRHRCGCGCDRRGRRAAVERARIDDPIGAIAAHGMAGVWGTLAPGSSPLPSQAKSLDTGSGGLFYGGGLHQLGVQIVGLAAVGAFTFTTSFARLWLMKVTFGIRTEPRRRSPASTSPSTACGAIPSSTSRFRAGTGRRRTGTSVSPTRRGFAVRPCRRRSPCRSRRARWTWSCGVAGSPPTATPLRLESALVPAGATV